MSKLMSLKNDKKNLFIQANMGESVMDTDIKNVRGFYELKKRADEQIFKLKAELEKYKGDLATLEEEYSELKPKTGMGKVYEKVHKVMAVILKLSRELVRIICAILSMI